MNEIQKHECPVVWQVFQEVNASLVCLLKVNPSVCHECPCIKSCMLFSQTQQLSLLMIL